MLRGLMVVALLLCGARAEAQIYLDPEPPPRENIIFMAGWDLHYSPVTADAPPVGSFEMAVTTRSLTLGYLVIRSTVLAYPFNRGAEELGLEGDVGLTQACFFCLSLGGRVAELESGGWIIMGGNYERIQSGVDGGYPVTAAGAELGWMQRTPRLDVQARLSLQALADDGFAGPRGWVDVRASLALTSWLGLYGHAGYAYAELDAGGTYIFHGPILHLGLAYLSR